MSITSLTLTSSAGSVPVTGDFEALRGAAGLGPARRSAVTFDVLGLDGLILNRRKPQTTTAIRLRLPVHVEGDNELERASMLAQLWRVLAPIDDTLVTLSGLRATSEGSEAVSVTGVAEFDGEAEFSALASFVDAAVVMVTLLVPDPTWYGQPRDARIERPYEIYGEDSFFPIFPLVFTPDEGFGTELEVVVGGDRLTWPTWEMHGPAQTVRVDRQDGATWEVDMTEAGGLAAGQVLTVTTDPRAVFDGIVRVAGPDGSSWWQYLTSSRRTLWPLRPLGEALSDAFTVTVGGLGAESHMDVTWRPGFGQVL